MFIVRIKLLGNVSFASHATEIRGYKSNVPRDWLGIPYIPTQEILDGQTLPFPDVKMGQAHPDGYFGLMQAACRLQNVVKDSALYVSSFFTEEHFDKKNFSRSCSLKAGQVFCAAVSFPKENFPRMEEFFRNIKHIGIKADDISGKVECTLVRNTVKSAANDSTYSDCHALDYTINIISPLCLPAPYDTDPKTLLYAPGTIIRKEICEQAVSDAKFKATNAYILQNGKRLLPVPLCMSIIKLAPEELRYRLARGKKPREVEQNIGLSGAFTRDFEKHVVRYFTPETVRIMTSSGKEYDALAPGQTLGGTVYGDDASLRQLATYIESHKFFALGAFNDEGYGEVRIQLQDLRHKKPSAEILARQFDVICLSDTIIFNDEGMPAYNAQALLTEVERLLGIKGKLKVAGKYTDVQKDFGLYNDWQQEGPIFRCLKAGSIVRLCTIDDTPLDIAPVIHAFVGERTADGYGEIAAYAARDGYYRVAKNLEPEKNVYGPLSPREMILYAKLTRYVFTQLMEKYVKFLALIDKADYRAGVSADELLPTLVFANLKEVYDPDLPLETMAKWYLEKLEEENDDDDFA